MVWQQGAGVFAADVAQHEELGRHAIELFADLFADAFEGLPAAAVGLLEFVVMINAGQVLGQRLTHRRAFGPGCTGCRLCGLFGRRILKSRVGQDVVKQYGLGAGVQAFAGGTEASFLEPGDFEVQGLNAGLTELEFAL